MSENSEKSECWLNSQNSDTANYCTLVNYFKKSSTSRPGDKWLVRTFLNEPLMLDLIIRIRILLAYSISELKFLWWIIYICTVDVQHFNSRQLCFLTPALPQLCPCSWLLYTKPFIAHLFFCWLVIVALNAALMWALILNECRCWTVWINKGNWNLKKTRGFDVPVNSSWKWNIAAIMGN